jgi:hypothetical protein
MQSYVDEKIETCNVGTWVPSGLHSGTGMLPLELLPLEIKTNGLFNFIFIHYSKLRLNKGHLSPDVSIFYLVANRVCQIKTCPKQLK